MCGTGFFAELKYYGAKLTMPTGDRCCLLPALFIPELRERLEAMLGEKAYDVLRDAGRSIGVVYAKEASRRANGSKDTLILLDKLVEVLEDTGWGPIEVLKADEDEVVLAVPETLSSASGKGYGCGFEVGALEGALKALMEAEYQVVEEECRLRGGSRCLFRARRL